MLETINKRKKENRPKLLLTAGFLFADVVLLPTICISGGQTPTPNEP